MYKSIVTKRSITNRLRKQCCFRFACQSINIPFNGNQMETWFSNHTSSKSRSGKFNKLLRDNSIPSTKTIACIDDKVDNFQKLFNASLWDALYCAENTMANITELLALQDLDVVTCLFEAKRDRTGNLYRKELYDSDVNRILKIGSISALSSLILLRLEFNKKICSVSKPILEQHISSLFINLCTLKMIPCMHWEIYDNLKNWFLTSSKYTLNNKEKLEKLTDDTARLLRYINLLFISHRDKNHKLLSFLALGTIAILLFFHIIFNSYFNATITQH